MRPMLAALIRKNALGVLLFAVASALLLYANYLVFVVVPNEVTMGAVQRILYFHVGSAIACYSAVAILLVSSLGYIATRNPSLNHLAVAANEVGVVFCSIVLVTGMIWGNAAWNTPFRMEPRLVSSLVLWLILISILVLRRFGDSERRDTHAAVMSVVGAIMIPIVILSMRFLPQTGQLHPRVAENPSALPDGFRNAMSWAIYACMALQFALIWLRARVEDLRLRVERLYS